tara:strand:- start:205 stop:1137 length:933 start_codon:yes stop_codon:yes gene_type:complete
MFFRHGTFGVWFMVHGGVGEVSDTESSIPASLSSRTALRESADFSVTLMHSTKMTFHRKVITRTMFDEVDFNFFELQKAVLMDLSRSTTQVEVEADGDVPVAVDVWIIDPKSEQKVQRRARISLSEGDKAVNGTFDIMDLFKHLDNDLRSVINDFHEQMEINSEKDNALLKMTKNLIKHQEIKERDDRETFGGFGVYVETMMLSQAKLQAALDRKTRENLDLPAARKSITRDGEGGGLYEPAYNGDDMNQPITNGTGKKRGRPQKGFSSSSASSNSSKIQRPRNGTASATSQSQNLRMVASLLESSSDED